MVVAAIDAGTTGVRCMLVDKSGAVIGIGRESWGCVTPSDLDIAKEIDTSLYWRKICQVTHEALKSGGKSSSNLEAIATTSQRMGMIILDADGKELRGTPNIDARGALTQYVVEESVGDRFQELTGCWPPMMFAPARLAWFEEEEPDVYEAIAHVLPISDWITYRLCSAFVTDPSSASATGFLDVRSRKWSSDVVEALNLEMKILPEIHDAGAVVGEITTKAAKETSLPPGLPVVQGGADTQCALLAAETNVDEITIVAGSTAPMMLVTEKAVCTQGQKIWTGCHVVPSRWVLESNAGLTGSYIEWAVGFLCERSENLEQCVTDTLSNLSDIVAHVPPGSNETYAALGPTIMDCHRFTDVRQAILSFPQPALPQVTPLDSASFLNAVLENIAYSARGNCEQLEEQVKVSAIKTIGGMTKSTVWGQLLANVLNRSIRIPDQSEGSLLGAAICAAKGAGWFSDLMEASEAMVQWHPPIEPDERATRYKPYYSRWKEIWYRGD